MFKMETSELSDLAEDLEISKRCYKCEHQLLDNLNIVYNASSSIVVAWNRFQILVYEDFNFESTAKLFVPDFQVRQIIISNNYLICLDTSGNVHTTSMKFKNPAQKKFRSSFQPRDQSVLACVETGDNILNLKYESDSYFLTLNKVNSEFTLEKKVSLQYCGRWTLPRPIEGKCLLTSHKLSGEEMGYVSTSISATENYVRNDYSLVIMCFDKLTVYGCLFSPKMAEEDVKLVKLYTCPSEICNVEIINLDNLYILIGLNIGTLVRLCLRNVINKPELVHLNTALHKFLTIKDTVLYTDGRSMWKTDNTFTGNITFHQFFVRQVKDFIKFGDQIICTTFSDSIYIFSLDDDMSYIKPETADEYCSAEKLLNNSEYLHKIIEELEKNNELTRRINEESNFVTALSLSNRQDIMDNVIRYSVTVYDFYEDLRAENINVLLTEDISKYFDPDSFQILVKLTATTLNHILSTIFNDVKIHLTLSTEDLLLKTTSVKVTDTFKKINILIPVNVNCQNMSEVNVNIEIISSVPGAYDEKQKLWITLYRKRVTLHSEHFIKSTATRNENAKTNESVEDLVSNVALTHYGSVYKFTDLRKHNLLPVFTVYLKLPSSYKELFRSETNSIAYLNKNKVAQLAQSYSSDDFLKSNSSIILEVGNKKVKVEILSDEFTSPLLKVSCRSMAVAFHIRNFFSKIVYENFRKYGPGKEFVKYLLYSDTENVKKEIKSCLLNQADFGEFQLYAEKFEKNIIGALLL